VGSVNYQPQQISNYAMFQQNPVEVWKWFLFRRSVCAAAVPNAGHLAIAQMEQLLNDRFTLITQNVDGLHLRAGNSLDRTYQIHGNLNDMRCDKECSDHIYPVPESIPAKVRSDDLSEQERRLLVCPDCGGRARPHVLLFDECYDETFYRFESSLRVATDTRLLIVVGTTGATTLPHHIVDTVYRNGGTIIDINIQENVFSDIALASPMGMFIKNTAAQTLAEMVELL
jgi:NAD-dependent deacetylase